MLSGPRNDTVGMLSGLRNESVDELTQQHASHAVAGGTTTRSWRSARATRGGVSCETVVPYQQITSRHCDRCVLRAGCVDGV